MANSITPSGTSRNVFDISLSDFETAGTITAGGFIGSGENLTKININSTEKILELSKGGTGNNTYNNGGLIYYNVSSLRFTNDTRLIWDTNERILKINNRDFLSDTSNYIKSTSNEFISLLNDTSNILSENINLNNNINYVNNISNIININNVSNYVLSTSNILIKYINSRDNNNSINIATKNNLGSVQIGEGIYVNKNGVISTIEEIINTTFPTFVDISLSFTTIEGLNYKVCKLLYNPFIGTTFDRTNYRTNILPIWYIFSNDNYIYTSISRKILNIGNNKNSLTNLELYGNVNIKPNIDTINIEYTPLNTTYLEFDNITTDVNDDTYCKFENDFNINNIYKTNNVITISFWLKVNFNTNEITIMEFSNTPTDDIDGIQRKININYVNNSLRFIINDDTNSIITPIISIQNIYKNRWYHIIWSIEKKLNSFNIQVNINGLLEKTQTITTKNYEYIYINGFKNYNKNYLSSPNNDSIYRFCISDFKIYNSLLSDDQKIELYNTNNYTKYIIEFKDDITICDILAYGGGGGGSSNYGGGAGKLVYINDANISSGQKIIKIGRGGSGYYSNINNNQVSLNGNNTTFENLIADGGGAMTNTLDSNNNYSHISTNIRGGCGSGRYGDITTFNKTPDLFNFLGNTSNIYSYGYTGGAYSGGGIGYASIDNNPGEGLYMLNDIINYNIDNTKYFNYKFPINFKNDFGLNNNEIGELYDGNIYIGSGGYGHINDGAQINRGYSSSNSGCGGNLGENGKNGALLIRVLTKIDRRTIPQYLVDTSNYIKTTSNNIIDYINRYTNPSAVIWTKNAENNINYQYNVGIGVNPPANYKLEIAQANVITQEIGSYGIHTSNNSNIILTDSINNNICAKFNSSIWSTGNIIASSDARIKTNINDISDDSALQMILNIQPKTYNYIDTYSKGNNKIYGFIAQQIKEVIPDAVKIEHEFIPNIFSVANYNVYGNIIVLQNNSINIFNIIKKNSRVKCYDMSDNIIVVEVVNIINANTFKIKDTYSNDKIFVYGSEVNDFHVLNKEYINTLNVCAVQELHRKIESQKNEINSLNEKINDIINFIDISK
jgi:hypothetical protein